MEAPLSANPAYALAQLARALETHAHHEDAATRERAARRIERWRQVLEGMSRGTITVGSRTPVASAPAWATLEVATGGFATGRLLAGGPLQPHERALAERLGPETGAAASAEGPSRAALNLYYLGDEGRGELLRLLRSGCYRVQVPEEGALLVVAWLIDQGHGERAQEVIDAIVSHLGQLRFYPVPDEQPLVPSAFVKLHSAAQVADALDATRPQDQVERMNEALRVWAPLYDRAVALFLETVEGETPSLRREASGELARRADGQPMAEGGWPCRRYPAGWSGRAQALLDEYEAARRRHGLCGKPEDPSENFAILRQALGACVKDPAALTGRDVGRIRKVLASFVSRHGAPASPEHARLREEQARIAALPTKREVAAVVSARLRRRPGDSGLESLEQVAGPLTEVEAGGRAGASVPAAIVAKLERCLEAPIEHLVERGVIPSSEVLAQVLPQITSQVKAAGVADPDLARLYAAIYSAFRRRRSLLLLDLASQVRLEELPWISALKGLRQQDVRDQARQTLAQVATLAIASFPQTILPNKLLQELRALVQDAGLALPLVDELAADIFMGQFSGKFLEAAKIAARLLRGTLYARYYALPVDRVLGLRDLKAHRGRGPDVSAGFAALCSERAAVKDGGSWSPARNGKIIEQEQILTTHNLAALWEALQLQPLLRARLLKMAQACFRAICREQQVRIDKWHAKLTRVKNHAYAWRQMIFFLSLAGDEDTERFLRWAEEHLGAQGEAFQRRFAPALRGLAVAAKGGDVDEAERRGAARRLLGWSTERHWLLAE